MSGWKHWDLPKKLVDSGLSLALRKPNAKLFPPSRRATNWQWICGHKSRFQSPGQLRALSIHYKYKLSYQKVTNDRALLGSMIKKLFEYLELQAKELSYINRFLEADLFSETLASFFHDSEK